MMHLRSTRSLAAIAVLAGALTAAFLPWSSAVALLSPPDGIAVTVLSPAALQAKGAAVVVPVSVTCPQGQTGSLQLSLTQRAGNTVVSGSQFTTVACTGAPQQVSVTVVAQPGGRAFKKGQAFAEASLFSCGYVCVNVTDSRTIQVR